MLKKIELVLDRWDNSYSRKIYYSPILCKATLYKYFELADNPSKITLIIRDRPTKNSYFVRKIKGQGRNDIAITLSTGKVTYEELYSEGIHLLEQYPSGCYVSIEA